MKYASVIRQGTARWLEIEIVVKMLLRLLYQTPYLPYSSSQQISSLQNIDDQMIMGCLKYRDMICHITEQANKQTTVKAARERVKENTRQSISEERE
jgi:hypothetical protein